MPKPSITKIQQYLIRKTNEFSVGYVGCVRLRRALNVVFSNQGVWCGTFVCKEERFTCSKCLPLNLSYTVHNGEWCSYYKKKKLVLYFFPTGGTHE